MKKYAYWLSRVPGMTAYRGALLRQNGISAEELYGMREQTLRRIPRLEEKWIGQITESQKTWDLDGEWAHFCESGIGFVSIEEPDYPRRLFTIVNPPYALYYCGGLPPEEKRAVAIVGARARSAYGSQIAEKLAAALAGADIAVISGLARGIDGDGHKGALAAGGKSYAVLGCGPDICYPRANRYLYDKMLSQGGIISEYPPGTAPLPALFPQRNRIIAGLSDVVVVIEARDKSGSLITADYAMEQGREVYALPGRVTDPLSSGCNRLIAQGAGILTGVEDFLRELALEADCGMVQMDFRKNLLEKDELMVYTLLDFYPMGLGTMVEKSPFCLSELLEILDRLEHKGFARETIPNYYVRTI
jgi:DNA processing protein